MKDKLKLVKPSPDIFDICCATDTLCNFSNYKVCMTCGDKLWVTKDIESYESKTGKPVYRYWFACNTVCKQTANWINKPWLIRTFLARPWHQIGCEDFGG